MPADEFMQTAARAYHFHAGAQPEVIRVSEYDRGVEVCRLQLLEANALDRAKRSDGHEDRSLDRAAPRQDDACARLALARERPPQERVRHYSALPRVECRMSACVDSIERVGEKTSSEVREDLTAERRQTNLFAQAENEVLPLLLEGVHVRLGEDFLQGVEAGRVCRAVGEELAVERDEQAALLQVVAEVARLRVVRALVLVVESPVVHRKKRLKRRQSA